MVDSNEDGDDKNDRRALTWSEVILANLSDLSGREEIVRRAKANLRGMVDMLGRAVRRDGPTARSAFDAVAKLRWRADILMSKCIDEKYGRWSR